MPPTPFGATPPAVHRAEGIDRAATVGGGVMAYVTDDVVRVGAQERLDSRHPLRHPGAAVEQFGRLPERGEIDGDGRSSQFHQTLDGGGEQRLGRFIAEEIEVSRLRHTEAETRRERLVLEPDGRRP